MKKWALAIIVIGLAAGGLMGIILTHNGERAAPPRAAAGEFREGQLFPTLDFPRLRDGRPCSVADFRGQKLVLHIFASW
jgi:hypothetical protein